ncbi:hypothetical protein HY251_13020 [bacterium]|nr:hypothetical protein [bacterium]
MRSRAAASLCLTCSSSRFVCSSSARSFFSSFLSFMKKTTAAVPSPPMTASARKIQRASFRFRRIQSPVRSSAPTGRARIGSPRTKRASSSATAPADG